MTNADTAAPQKTPVIAESGPPSAPQKKAARKTTVIPSKHAAKGRKAVQRGGSGVAALKKRGKTDKKPVRPVSAKKAIPPRAETKGAKILKMIGRPDGATLAEIMKAARWQAHSVRGFISVAADKYGVKIESGKSASGDRRYKIVP